MKRTVIIFVVIAGLSLTLHQSLSAQEERIANKIFYTELGGPGLIMSANIDSRFKSNERLGLGFRLGAGFCIGDFDGYINEWGYRDYVTRTYYSIPVGLNYLFGKSSSSSTFEVGGGVTFLTRKVSLFYYDVEKPGNMIGFATFMYRRMPVNGGFSFRAGFTPIIGTSGDLFPMGAVGIGFVF